MANVTTFETKFSKRMQVVHYKKDVFRAFVSMEERSNLKSGQAVVRPYRSSLVAQSYTRGSNLSFQTTTDTNETLTVNTSPAVPFTVDSLDALQSNYQLQSLYAEDAARKLGNEIDGDVLAEVASAVSTVDAASFGGSAGNGIVLSTSNILSVLFKANQKLNAQNIDVSDRFCVLSPEALNYVQEYWAGRETASSDQYGMNGFMGRMANAELYMSNSTYWTGVLSIATQPTDGDTVTINGVTFTFKTVLGATPGNVLIGASADAARLNLTTLINAPSATTSEGVALSAANQALLRNISAVDAAGANTMTVAAKGWGTVVVSEVLTDGTDAWTKKIQHLMFGRKNAIDLVIQQEPTTKVDSIPEQLGVYVKPYTLYGKKTFAEGAKALVDILIDASVFA